MASVLSSVQSLMQMFDGKRKEFIDEIDNVHMVWLEEIEQEANRMFSRDFNAEPELMPKTPSQKKNSRRKRVSVGRLEENQARRFSRGKRSNLRGSSVKSLNFITEEGTIPDAPEASTSDSSTNTQPKRATRKNKQTKSEVAEDVSQPPLSSCTTEEVWIKKPELVEVDKNREVNHAHVEADEARNTAQPPPKVPSPEVVVCISSTERRSAELAEMQERSPGRTAAKIAIAGTSQSSRRSSVRHSLKVRHSLAGLRHSMTQESVRRASRRSMLKKRASRMANSTCSSNVTDDSCMESAEEDGEVMSEAVTAAKEVISAGEESKKSLEKAQTSYGRITRSVAANSPKLAPPAFFAMEQKMNTPNRKPVPEKQQNSLTSQKSRQSTKRKAPDCVEESPTKRLTPPKKSQNVVKPNMRSFLHTVQKNQMLMMTPNSLGRTGVMKSFIKHTTPLKVDPKAKERLKLEALKKKQEQEEERMKKMEEDKKKKQDELKRKRDERLRRVFEAKVKEEQREEEKKKKIEQKMAQIEKNEKLMQRQAEEKAKKKVALKRQEELELKRKLEEEAKKKKEEERRQLEERKQQELVEKKKAEEEEARRATAQAAAERERAEREKALALQRELEKAAREKERRELEEKRKALEEKRKWELAKEKEAAAAAKEREEAAAKQLAAKQAAKTAACLNVTVDIERSILATPVGKGAGLNVTVDVEKSPQSYPITPTAKAVKPLVNSLEDYGMDQNSDDSTDDETCPRKAIPSWAEGQNLQQIIMKQYFNPPNLDSMFGTVEPPKLENIFYKSKPRYFKRTSSAVWHSPPIKNK